MIVEGLLTTMNAESELNVAPMGPIVTGDYDSLLLRPFQSSTSYLNLQETRCGVFHVVDSVAVIAEAAIGRIRQQPAHEPAAVVDGRVLLDCCRWFEFSVASIDSTHARSEITTKIVHRGHRRHFFGFNRARHAVIEAAILASRVHLLDRNDMLQQFATLRSAVLKTGGEAEIQAFDQLTQFVERDENELNESS